MRPEKLRQALAERVARRLEGQGAPCTAVDAAVTLVLDAPGRLSFVMEEE
ncbi:MAG TPA: hypothetical protein VHM67_12700 [Gemmatimonadaceae bacterium]|nr:hypothetical protein [Gemmatimonadaceae bacterium]